jgi:hypothetical protein
MTFKNVGMRLEGSWLWKKVSWKKSIQIDQRSTHIKAGFV